MNLTAKHYWAVSQMGQFDDHVRNNRLDIIEEAWKVLFPDQEIDIWELEFEEFMSILIDRLTQVGNEIKTINKGLQISSSVSMIDWMNRRVSD